MLRLAKEWLLFCDFDIHLQKEETFLLYFPSFLLGTEERK